METTTEAEAGAILRLIDPAAAYIAPEFQQRVADRSKVARILAGRISQEQLAEAVIEHTGADWSRNMVANFELNKPRKRLTVTDVEHLAATFREVYGLEQVDLDWLVGGVPGSFPSDLPGYLSSLDELVAVIDLTDGVTDAA